MRWNLVLLVLSVGLLADNASAALNIAGILELAVRFILLNLTRMGSITLTNDTTLNIPESIKDVALGQIRLQDLDLSGFDTLKIVNLAAEDLATTDDSTKANLCLNITIDQLQLQTKYDADVGILNEIPIYGVGQLKLAVSKVVVGLCLNINLAADLSKLYVDDLSLLLKFHDSPSSITGFWKNDSVSDFVSLVINILETFISMWITYEDECISCVISPIAQYVVNSLFNTDVDDPEINCSCLQGTSGTKYKIEDKLERLMKAFYKVNTTNAFDSEDISQFKEIVHLMTNNIVKILNKEGVFLDV